MNWRTAQRLGTVSESDENSPEAVMLGSDVALAVWKQRGETDSALGALLSNCYDTNGNIWGTPQPIAPQQATADLAGDPNLGAVVVWDQNLDIYAAWHPPVSTPCVR